MPEKWMPQRPVELKISKATTSRRRNKRFSVGMSAPEFTFAFAAANETRRRRLPKLVALADRRAGDAPQFCFTR
jgi:hypothetical protein